MSRDKRTDVTKGRSPGKSGHGGNKAGPILTTIKSSPLKAEPPRPLTLKEKRVLEFLESYVRSRGVVPTYQEICNHFGFASYNSVQRYLKQLESKGYIHVPGGNQKRAMTLLQPASAIQALFDEMQKEYESSVIPAVNPMVEALSLPLLGRVAAGAPIEAYEHDEFIEVPASLVRNADRTYALRVQGQSMIDDGIFDGDVILVQRQSYASSGEIVVAMIGDEATVKRFYSHTVDADQIDESGAVDTRRTSTDSSSPSSAKRSAQKLIELRPANSSMSSLWYRPHEVELRGIVVGLIRKF